jgi:hypothetical protein
MLADCGSACIVAAFTSSFVQGLLGRGNPAVEIDRLDGGRPVLLGFEQGLARGALLCLPLPAQLLAAASGTLGSSLLGRCSDSCLCGPDGFRRCLGETQRIALVAEAAKRGLAVGLRRTGNGEKRAAEEKRR